MGLTVFLKATREVPVNINMYSYNFPVKQIHHETELLFCLYGEFDITIGDQSSHMIPEDICLINSNELHYIYGLDSAALSISFPLDQIPGFQYHHPRFLLNSCGHTDSPRYDAVRHLVAQLVQANMAGEDPLGTMSVLYSLLRLLEDEFKNIPYTDVLNTGATSPLISQASDYLYDHFRENLSLSDLAQQLNVSAQYLSSLFRRQLGQTFTAYYNDIRLSNAMHDMLTSPASLENIALGNGFSDIRAFTAAFRKKYGDLPSRYRRQHRMAAEPVPGGKVPPPEEQLESLARYLHAVQGGDRGKLSGADSEKIFDAGRVNFQSEGIALKHNFKTMLCVGSARQFLYADIQDMVRRVQDEIGYRYVKFHGILSDEMMVYDEDADGNPFYSFVLIDKVLDFLRSVGLKPLVQLSFMPVKLASEPARLVDHGSYNTSPPKSMSRWAELVRALVTHMIRRFGREEVLTWLFCVWNEADSPSNMFGWEDEYLFREFYRRTYATVKEIDPALPFGTPSLLVNPDRPDSWTGRFLQYCSEYNCMPDFLNVHYYDNNFQAGFSEPSGDGSEHSLAQQARTAPLAEDPFSFNRFIDNFKQTARQYRLQNIPIYLTEWNLTVSHRDPVNDTCFKACYLTKNLLQNYDRLASYGYWCLSDFHEEMLIPDALFHGGLGLFTYNGIPKAHYHAFRFLGKLGDVLLATAYGYMVTRKGDGIVMILYNYEHYSRLYARRISFGEGAGDRYAGFANMTGARFTMHLERFPAAGCYIREHVINKDSGSSFDAWTRMGSPTLENAEDYRLLKDASSPALYLRREKVTDGCLSYSAELKPLEVRLVEIHPA